MNALTIAVAALAPYLPQQTPVYCEETRHTLYVQGTVLFERTIAPDCSPGPWAKFFHMSGFCTEEINCKIAPFVVVEGEPVYMACWDPDDDCDMDYTGCLDDYESCEDEEGNPQEVLSRLTFSYTIKLTRVSYRRLVGSCVEVPPVTTPFDFSPPGGYPIPQPVFEGPEPYCHHGADYCDDWWSWVAANAELSGCTLFPAADPIWGTCEVCPN